LAVASSYFKNVKINWGKICLILMWFQVDLLGLAQATGGTFLVNYIKPML
jgi:hypothetical protein